MRINKCRVEDISVGVADGSQVEDNHKGAQDEEDDQGRVEFHHTLAVKAEHIQEFWVDEQPEDILQ